MVTLITCVHYPEYDEKERYRNLLEKPVHMLDFRAREEPKEVLERALPDFYLRSYLGVAPWMVNVGNGRAYLDIIELDDNYEKQIDGSFDNFLKHPNILVARRKHTLDQGGKSELTETILNRLKAENKGMFIPSGDVSRVYSDVLNALGYKISREEVSEMLSAQFELKHQEEIAERFEMARRMNEEYEDAKRDISAL